MTDPVQEFLNRLPTKPTPTSGGGWSARCPAHEDGRESLSVSTGEGGRVLVCCHAGCTAADIAAAVGMKPSDLFPSTNGKPRSSGHKPATNGKPHNGTTKPAKPKPTFPTAKEAIAELERKHGKRSALWTYHKRDGKPWGCVLRWNLGEGKKRILPVALDVKAGGWIHGGMPEPRPLLNLPELLDGTGRVYITEGEPASDAARNLGLLVTCSAHGSQSAGKTDWTPLAGRDVIILPDNDEAGEAYAATVSDILRKLNPPATVRVLNLPGLPKKGDMVQYVEQNPGAAADDINALADATEPLDAAPRPTRKVIGFEPFPVDALPEPLRRLATEGAKAIGTDPSYIALPALAVCAAAIGNTRSLMVKPGWFAPSIIWAVTVGESGTAKTPAFGLALKPLDKLVKAANRDAEERTRTYAADHAHYERALAEWKRDRKNSQTEPPTKPPEPQAVRYRVSDTTVEGLAPLLLANPRGLLVARDELAGWLGSFDRYATSGKGGADASHWLSMHNAQSLVIDRKTGIPRTLYVHRASVSVCGGIQPGILRKALGTEHRESGLAARLLLAYPPRTPKRWTEAEIDERTEADYERAIGKLYELQPAYDSEGDPRPHALRMTHEAKRVFIDFYNAHAGEAADLAGDLSAVWSKLEEYACRLALVIHLIRSAAEDPSLNNAEKVDAESMRAAVKLVQWFKREARRVYAAFSETDDEREQRRLIEWIERRGGAVTVRDVYSGCRWLSDPTDAEAALTGLAEAGFGTWESKPASDRGGRPTRTFRLAQHLDESTETEAEEIPVAAHVADHEPEPFGDDADWGTV